MTSRQIYYVNSANRLSGSDSDFTYKILTPPGVTYDHAVILAAKIPRSYYLVDSTNRTFTLTELGASTVITLPIGNYTRKSFVAAVTGLLNAGSIALGHTWVYTIAYANALLTSDDGKLTFSVTGNGGSQPSLTFNNSLSACFGFPQGSFAFVGNSLKSQYAIDLIPEDTLFIHSDLVQNNNNNVLCDIYAAGMANFSSIIYENYSADFNAKEIATTSNSVYRFTLTDEFDKVMDLNGQNMVFTLCLYAEDKTNSMFREWMKYTVAE